MLSLPQNLASLTNDSSFYYLLSSFIEKISYDSKKLDGLLNLSNTNLPLNILSYLNYLKTTNEAFYQDIISLPYFLNWELVDFLGSGFKFLTENKDAREHISFVMANLGENEIEAILEELSKIVTSFQNPEDLFRFVLDVSGLASELLDIYKTNISNDDGSIEKLNRLYTSFLTASKDSKFEKEFSLVLSSRYIIKAARLIGRGVVESNPKVESLFVNYNLEN